MGGEGGWAIWPCDTFDESGSVNEVLLGKAESGANRGMRAFRQWMDMGAGDARGTRGGLRGKRKWRG